ncbi:MAG: tRNA1(Val) (adenine(37)-N6)-methyltransferase [Acidobacteriota bacterium]
MLLAGLAGVKPEERVADLGTGCGVVPLILAYRGLVRYCVGIEIQPELAALARENVEANGFSDRVEIREMDFREAKSRFPTGSFDLVVSNPPYRRVASGRINVDRQRAVARHELSGSVSDVFAVGKHLLAHGGRLAVIYPATRLTHLMVTAHRHGFSPKELTVIHSDSLGPGRLVYLECRKGGGEELRIGPALYIYRDGGKDYTERMSALYNE